MLLYLAGSIIGIALLVALNFVLFGAVRADLGGAGQIAERLALESPGFRLGRLALAADGHAALAEDAAHNAIFFMETLGDGVITRKLSRTGIRKIERNGATLLLDFFDFTLPRARLDLGNEAVACDWVARLEAP